MRMLLTGLSVITVFVVMPAVSGGQQAAGPRIVVDEVRYHAGKVVQGSRVSHVFTVGNAGSETLVIERVQPG